MGNQKVMKQLAEWKNALDSYQPTSEDPFCMRAIGEVFFPELSSDIDLGSKWVHQDTDSTDVEKGILGFVSAWGPPNELLKKIACLLFKLDKRVVICNYYNIELSSVGVTYVAPHDAKNAYLIDAEVNLDDGFDDSCDAEEAAYEELSKQELVILDYFLDDMIGTVKTINKHMPNLEIDWSKYR